MSATGWHAHSDREDDDMFGDSAMEREARSLSAYLDELADEYSEMAQTDPRRDALEARIIIIENELMARGEL